jgi:hypothetical protein
MTIPAGAWELITAYGSQRLRVRWWILAISGAIVTVGFGAPRLRTGHVSRLSRPAAMFLGSTSAAVGYAACFVTTLGLFPNGVLANAWSAINAGTVRMRQIPPPIPTDFADRTRRARWPSRSPSSGATPAVSLWPQVTLRASLIAGAGLVGIWTVLPADAPRYKNAYAINLSMGVIQAVGPVLLCACPRHDARAEAQLCCRLLPAPRERVRCSAVVYGSVLSRGAGSATAESATTASMASRPTRSPSWAISIPNSGAASTPLAFSALTTRPGTNTEQYRARKQRRALWVMIRSW